MAISHNLGFPRIGKQRELKKAVENYWKGNSSEADLLVCQHRLQQEHWQWQQQAGIEYIPVGDFAFYDHVLNTSLLFNVIPQRFQEVLKTSRLETYFCMARGITNAGYSTEACEMTKFFNTNYHYIVPEFSHDQVFSLHADELIQQIKQAQALGIKAKPVILGPLSFLYLGKTKDDFNKLELLDKLLPEYSKLFDLFAQAGIDWVQIDEPIFTLDLADTWLNAFKSTYNHLHHEKVKLLFTTYFGPLNNHAIISDTKIAGLHIDHCQAPEQLDEILAIFPTNKVLSIGIVNGRNIWRNDLKASLAILAKAHNKLADNLWVGPSCSLLFSPVDLSYEKKLDSEIKTWLAFAKQKLNEISVLTQAINDGESSVAHELKQSAAIVQQRTQSSRIHNPEVKQRVVALTKTDEQRQHPYAVRQHAQAQELGLPVLPTTTIGSFPQTQAIRQLRRDFKQQKIDANTYQTQLKAEINNNIAIQTELDLDVLVHGEPERNDMVEYFGELLNGFAFTENGWVQSYGSRCVKPPIIYGDVSRPKPMTVAWTQYAQSQTDKPMKGMLTGPVTILSWSFPRDDQAESQTSLQIALALRDEVIDLEKAGINVIQIDEPAFREHLPLRQADQAAYIDWAVRSFKIASAGVKDSTQIHTHMCYSEFNDIIEAIAALDADVITIENSRSDAELLKAFERFDYPNQIGPGVYDIHSPRIPSVAEIEKLLTQILKVLPLKQVWVNPDCGLKTRNWDEVKTALANMVSATKKLRQKHAVAVVEHAGS
ncbi:MAG: 5-methyltetrahydropteroyltriglutamate--homocysteine S-methyltransferase [Pseudomonadota bacterium]